MYSSTWLSKGEGQTDAYTSFSPSTKKVQVVVRRFMLYWRGFKGI